MVGRAFQFDVPAVQEKSLVGIEPNRANAEGRLVTVHCRSIHADRGDEFVQLGRFDGP